MRCGWSIEGRPVTSWPSSSPLGVGRPFPKGFPRVGMRGQPPLREEVAMSEVDKLKNKGEELKGNVKEGAGRASGDKDLEAEGQADQSKGNLKQAGEKVKDAFKGN